MRRVRKILLTVLTVAFVVFCTLFAISCGKQDSSAFKLSKSKVSVSVGKESAAVSVLKDGEEYLGPVSWVCGDSLVAQVNQGKIAGIRAGETDVKAYIPYGEKTFVLSCKVKVQSSVTADIVDMYAYAGTGTIDVALPAGMLTGGAKITEVSYSTSEDGANATTVQPTIVGEYFLENEADSPLTPGTYYLFYKAEMDGVSETFARRLHIRAVDRYEDLFLLAPFDNENEDVYGFSQAMNWWGSANRLDENPGEYVRYTDSAINVGTGMNETREELIESLQASSYDGYLNAEKQIAGFDTVYRMYSEKYNKTSTPRPFFFFNLFHTANPAWNALSELPDDATISIWARTWFKGEDDKEYSHRSSNWMYFFRNMNGGIEQIPAAESSPASYDPVGGWSNYRIQISKIREALSGANNLAFAIQVDGNERGTFYFELYSVELMAANDILASTNVADVTLPGLYSGYFDSYDWSIEALDESNPFSANGTHENTNVSVPLGEYKVTYIPKLGSKALPSVERTLYSGLVKNFTKASDVSKGSWSRSNNVRVLTGSDIPQEVGTPTVVDGYQGFLSDSEDQRVIAIDKFASNEWGLARVDVNWNIGQLLSIVMDDMQKDESERVLKDSDYIGIWTYIPAVKEEASVRFYLAEGIVHNSNDQYTVGGGVINGLTKVNGWFQVKVTVADMKTAINKKPTVKIEQNVSGKPSMKEVAIKYDTIGIEIHCDDGLYSKLPKDKKDIYLYSVEFGRSLETAKSNELNGVSVAYSDNVWTKATFNGVVKNALTGDTLVENKDYEIKNGKFVSTSYGEYVLEYEVEKDGYSYGLAERNVILEKDKNSPMGYNVISDLMSSKDLFYHISESWGESAITHNPGAIRYGNMKIISDADYEALVDAGYRGSLDKKAVWRVNNVQPVCTSLGQYHNGYRTAIQAGSAMFNDELIDLINDESVDLSSAYISVWMRASSVVDFRYTSVVPYKTGGGIYDSQHMGSGTGLESQRSQTGMVATNNWIEHRFYIDDLTAKVGANELKGLGFQFAITNNYTVETEDKKGAIVDYVDIYSIELCFDDAKAYSFAESEKIGLPSLGVSNFTQNIEVYDQKGQKLTNGVDYTLSGDFTIKDIAAGEYTLKYTVDGDEIEQTSVTRVLTVDQAAHMSQRDISSAGWRANGFTGSESSVSAQPDGYNGNKTDLTTMKGIGGDVDKNQVTKIRAGLNVSELISNVSLLKNNQVLSIWFRFHVPVGEAVVVDGSRLLLVSGTNGNNWSNNIILKNPLVTSDQVNSGKWLNVTFSKVELNQTGVEGKTHLYFDLWLKGLCEELAVEFFSVEIIEKENPSIINFDPNLMVSAGWNGALSTAECTNQKLTEVTVPNGYNGKRIEKTALHWQSVNSIPNSMAIDVSLFLANIDEYMDDNDLLSIWVKYNPSTGELYKSHISLRNANYRNASVATIWNNLKTDFYTTTGSNRTTSKGEWVEVQFTKAQLKSAYTDSSVKWLVFYVEGANGATIDSYIYDIAVIKVN